jgi:hypothetical protein
MLVSIYQTTPRHIPGDHIRGAITFASKCFGLVDVDPRGPEGNSTVGRVWEGSRAVALAVHETSFRGFNVVLKLVSCCVMRFRN